MEDHRVGDHEVPSLFEWAVLSLGDKVEQHTTVE